MARRRRRHQHSSRPSDNPADNNAADDSDEESRLPTAMRERNRAVAEREASRLARPERRSVAKLGHASRAKSAVTSTPFGYHSKSLSDLASGGDNNDDNEWCGPFSVARQMIAKREEARRQREADQAKDESHHPLDDMMAEVELERKRKAHPSLQWRARLPADRDTSSDNLYSKRMKRIQARGGNRAKAPTLFQLCVDFLVENFEHVEALGDVDSSIRSAICKELVAKKKMDGAAFDAIAETGLEALELVDCSEVTHDQLADALESLVPAGLRFLLLNHSGRCFGPKAVKAIISSTTTKSSLFALSIGGAYMLKDDDAASLVSSTASTLSSLEFKACPLLGSVFCNSLSQSFASPCDSCLLELSFEDLGLTKESMLSIGSSNALRNLKSLRLRQIKEVDDDVVSKLLGAIGDNLESVDLSYNHLLTDETLSAIRRCNESGALRSLQLCGLKNLSAAGLEAAFTQGIPGLPNPPVLRTLNLANCDFLAVTDEVVQLVTKASAVVKRTGGLVHLNINGASCTDDSMECLAATSASSLKELDVSFCPNVTDQGIGYLVSVAGNQFAKVHIWGCAQLTDVFLDGHSRVGDGQFEVIGAWMKKSGGRSLR